MKKNYYAVIPASVRYDKELPMGARMLYGELTALSNEKGYCWATNKYFAELYDVTTVTVSNWISKLEARGHIRRVIVYAKNSKEIEERRIYIVGGIKENFNTPQRNFGEGLKENFNTPIKENFKENITSFNNTSNITDDIRHISDPTIRECLNILKGINNYPFDVKKDLDHIATLAVDFPNADLVNQVKRWKAYKLDKPLLKNSNARLQLRNWLENAEKWRRERVTHGTGGERNYGKTQEELDELNQIDWSKFDYKG